MMDINVLSNEELAVAYIGGNNRAFDLLLSRTKDKLYQYIIAVVRDQQLADDIFQDTFLKAITKMQDGSYSANGKFAAWILRIAHNCIMDVYRRRCTDKTIDVGEDNNIANVVDTEHEVQNIEMEMVRNQNLKEATQLMNALPMTQREIVYMRLYQELSFKEIAESTGMSINTALGRMRYAIINMRKMASEYRLAI